MDKEKIQNRITEIEGLMNDSNFWNDKDRAQNLIKEMNTLKDELQGFGAHDRGNAILTILAGAGGDDAEDFAGMLFLMYQKYSDKAGFGLKILHQNQNDHGGFRNITFEISGKNVYGILKNESGVHRLVRLSPFNANQKRHTSFCLVEVLPEIKGTRNIEIPESDLEVSFARSSGPGGQNVNKRETAVRVVHLPTKISVHVESERSQAQNREKALDILCAKIFKLEEEKMIAKEKGMQIASTTSVEWGNQIRSYVMHPYKMVKDHRTGVEVSKVDDVLDGEIDEFLEAERGL